MKFKKPSTRADFGKSRKIDKKLKETDGLQEHLYDLICEASILKYQSADLGIDDVVYTDEVIGDE